MADICDTKKCTGCMACFNVCPVGAISMDYNEKKELSPIIDQEACLHCSMCESICPANNNIDFREPIKTYACWDLDEEKRKTSSSGGIASTLYEKIIEKGGVVFGCYYDNDLKLIFSHSESFDDIQRYKTSKYSQAYIGTSYKEAESFLKEGKEVLFIGTPCQVQGLKNYLRKDYENLYLVDIICHGVPSQNFIDEYIKSLNLNDKPDNLTFRGLFDFYFTLYKQDEVLYKKKAKEDEYYYSFLKGLFYRESCYQCRFAQSKRCSDMTIGDFWRLGDKVPFEHDQSLGVTAALINTEKGAKLFDMIKERIFFEQRAVSEAVEGNEQLNAPSKKNENYELFQKLYKEQGFKKAISECYKKLEK